MIDKIIKALSSRTVWSVIVLVAINIVNLFGSYLPVDLVALLSSILGAMAVYFKVNPSQKY